MSLWRDMQERCTLLELRRVPDGEGGFAREWADGPEFDAAVTLNTSAEERVAEQQGADRTYTVTTEAELLGFNDRFRRNSDGQVFRVTSYGADGKTPWMATFAFAQCTAEAVRDGE